MSENRKRTVRMTDYMWETLDDLARHNGRTIGEEIRLACEERLEREGYEFDEARAKRETSVGFRKVEAA